VGNPIKPLADQIGAAGQFSGDLAALDGTAKSLGGGQ
jgi:hypothetical protein